MPGRALPQAAIGPRCVPLASLVVDDLMIGGKV